MKLYTESQVLNMLNMTDEVVNGDLYTYDEIIKSQTPKELPSDEEIKAYVEKTLYGEKKYYFKAGVEFMKEQILNQNNNNERVTTDNDRVY